jgi:nitrogen fixation NifU-like protein
MLTAFFISTAIMFLTIGLWSFFHMRRSCFVSPSDIQADSRGCITGDCGDTMEIILFFERGRVVRSLHRTDGCARSFTCMLAASRLALGKTAEDLFAIDRQTVENNVGGLPEDHKHCAGLAVRTLHSAADDYMKQMNRSKGKIS